MLSNKKIIKSSLFLLQNKMLDSREEDFNSNILMMIEKYSLVNNNYKQVHSVRKKYN
jgi:hypothetical protein